jgi:hypothetical protein
MRCRHLDSQMTVLDGLIAFGRHFKNRLAFRKHKDCLVMKSYQAHMPISNRAGAFQ